MEFRKRFGRDLKATDLNDALADFQGDIETYLTQMINASHAPLMIPRTTIEMPHPQYDFAAADRVAVLASLRLQNTITTTSATYVTGASYTGRGILQKVIIGEFTSGATAAFTGSIRITIDGNVVQDGAPLARRSSLRTVLGNQFVHSTTEVELIDDSVGLPYNSSCLIEIAASASVTMTLGWKVALKNA